MKASEYIGGAQFCTKVVLEIYDAETGTVAMREVHEELVPVDYENALATKYAFMQKLYCNPKPEDAEVFGIAGPIAKRQFGLSTETLKSWQNK